jgi:hypothetical protein
MKVQYIEGIFIINITFTVIKQYEGCGPWKRMKLRSGSQAKEG